MTSVIYIFSDPGVPTACKIGKNLNWPSRYVQARCHTPRGIHVDGLFRFETKDAAKKAEQAVKHELRGVRRRGDVIEWFDLPPAAATEHLVRAGILDPQASSSPLVPSLKPAERQYDDWREQRSKFMGYRWRLWLFEEQSPERPLKLSYGALYDTAYRYAFTYNPWPVRLIAGFEHRAGIEAESMRNEGPNAEVREAWERLQGALGNLSSEQVGWFRSAINAAEVAQHLTVAGIQPFRLDRVKPMGAPPKDASVSPPTSIGTPLPLGRVAPSPTIYPRAAA